MKVLVCCIGGLGDAVALLPTLDALNDGLDQPEITVLCPPRLAGLLTISIPGIRPIPIDLATLRGLAGSFRLPAIAAQIGRVDVALVAPHQSKLLYTLARRVAAQVIGFDCASLAEQKALTVTLPYDPTRPVPDTLCDVARLLLDWPDMPLRRVAPLPRDLYQDAFVGLPDLPDLPDLPGLPDLPDLPDDLAYPVDLFEDQQTPYGVIHMGAGTPLQRWNSTLFGPLADALERYYGFPWRVILDDSSYDLIDLAALLTGARGFVGCHSGPLQLAAAQGVPWIAVAGPTPQAWDPPWQDVPGKVLRLGLECQPCGSPGQPLAPCPYQGHCLAALTVADVLKVVQAVIPRTGKPEHVFT